MDIQQTQQNAFRLHQIIRAWCLHQTTAYDAWESNFVLSEKFNTFLKNSKIKGSTENKAIRFAIALQNAAIAEYINFVVVTLQHSVEHLYYKNNIQNLILEYEMWIRTSCDRMVEVYHGFSHSFRNTESHLVSILEDVHSQIISPILAAEIISELNDWDEIWKSRENSTDFVFDLVWPQVHKYKPLFIKE